MKKLLILLLGIPFLGNSQNDTIRKTDGKLLSCTITLDNEFTVFYQIKGVGYEISKDKLVWYSLSGKRKSNFSLADKTTLINGHVIVDNIDINTLDIKYCEIIGYDFEMKNGSMIITLDYGQTYVAGVSMKIQDSEGKNIVFNSMMDALNFMEKSGWEYVNQYGVGSNSKKVYRILLKRRR
ncbi:MAG: hypothetical protein V4677_02015 [Bacteroidota bacterium]